VHEGVDGAVQVRLREVDLTLTAPTAVGPQEPRDFVARNRVCTEPDGVPSVALPADFGTGQLRFGSRDVGLALLGVQVHVEDAVLHRENALR